MSIDTELATLRAEVTALRAEIEALRNPRRSIPVQRLDREVRIIEPTPVSNFAMPTPDEIDRLVTIVGKHFQILLPIDRHEFELAFEALGNMRRLDRPDTGKYLPYHAMAAEAVLKSFRRPSVSFRGTAFIAAILAHGDIPISGVGRAHEGVMVEVGLHQHVGRPAGDAWRRIIEGAAPREVAVSVPVARPSPATIWHY